MRCIEPESAVFHSIWGHQGQMYTKWRAYIIWAKFGHFRCYYLGQVGVIIWAKLFLAYKNSGFKRYLAHTVIILCFFLCPIIWQLSENCLFHKRVQKLGFSIFCVLS